jgi:hypothetical protein
VNLIRVSLCAPDKVKTLARVAIRDGIFQERVNFRPETGSSGKDGAVVDTLL